MRHQGWRRAWLGLGLLLFMAGAAILGVGLYTYFQGDGAGSAEAPALRTLSNTVSPDRLLAKTLLETSTPPQQTSDSTPPPLPRDAPYRMVIESIGVAAPVLTYSMDGSGVPQVPYNGGEIAWYDFSASPGTGSNAVFAGHVNWSRAPAVFANLKDLKLGDTIRLVADNGTELVYVVSDNYLVDPADPASLQVMAPTPTDTITLITCGGTWIPDPSQRFGGDYTNRVIVRASLVSVNAVGVPQDSGGS